MLDSATPNPFPLATRLPELGNVGDVRCEANVDIPIFSLSSRGFPLRRKGGERSGSVEQQTPALDVDMLVWVNTCCVGETHAQVVCEQSLPCDLSPYHKAFSKLFTLVFSLCPTAFPFS
jgi:hypothetical protein